MRFILLLLFSTLGLGYHYDPEFLLYNLNTNQTAQDPYHYWGQREPGHVYHPSPENWRFPFYTIFLDRFVNGDPFNDNINGTAFEHDIWSNQMRHGGDLYGLLDTLDYLQGMGIRGLYLAGSPFINAPWGYDGYSPLDMTLLDPHFGDLGLWKYAIDEIHSRGMYVLLDNTFATMGDLIGFEGYLNQTAPFDVKGYPAIWKGGRRYADFDINNSYNDSCVYPRFYNETGFPVDESVTNSLKGCYNSEFDQYGDTEAFGVYPDWRRQLTKFASVQDRLAEWKPSVRTKIENFYCMMIAQLDIDGYRYDKALQATVDAMAMMNKAMRTCAGRFNKTNFFLPGEITGGNQLGSVWLGRGRQPDMLPPNVTIAVTANLDTQNYSIRTPDLAALDGAAFHYSTYRALTRFLGMDGNLKAGYDTPVNFVDMWNTFLMTNDMTNANTGEWDPRHMFGIGNQDVFRWPAIWNGTERQILGHFITTLLLPGIPLLLWGEEQEFYVLDSTADNYIFGRQPLSSASAWQTHGCYSLGSTQYYQWPVKSARQACRDDSVSNDHRDPSAPIRNILKHMFHLRDKFKVLNDGMWLEQLSNHTREVYMPGSSGVATEMGLWSAVRSMAPSSDSFWEPPFYPVWMLYNNDNATTEYNFDCADETERPYTTALLAPYPAGTTVKNLFPPFDELTLGNSSHVIGLDSGASTPNGCLSGLTMAAWSFRMYVPKQYWVGSKPTITRFVVANDETQGHDARIVSTTPETTIPIAFYFSGPMNCSSITRSLSVSSSTVSGRVPKIDLKSVKCEANMTSPSDRNLQGLMNSTFAWRANLVNVEHGVHRITVGNLAQDFVGNLTQDVVGNLTQGVSGNPTQGVVDHFLIRVGNTNNPVIFPRLANYSTTLLQQDADGSLFVQHTADGADNWRYSTNWGSSFSAWTAYTGGNTTIDTLDWNGAKHQEWEGKHVIVEYFNRLVGASDIVQEGDLDAPHQRKFPHLFWNGDYNQYGFDAGLDSSMKLVDDNIWTYDFMTDWPAVAQINVWGMNPDGQPDQTYVLGDIDGDGILDRLPPSALSPAILNITSPPSKPWIGWSIKVNDSTRRFDLLPLGSIKQQIAVFVLLWVLPVLCALLSTYAYVRGFYQVKINRTGLATKLNLSSKLAGLVEGREPTTGGSVHTFDSKRLSSNTLVATPRLFQRRSKLADTETAIVAAAEQSRRTVLIGTMEYDIEDWKIKVKIGGLGVIAQLMGKALGHIDLIWVIPCVGGVEYPVDIPAAPMTAVIFGTDYSINVQYHVVNNITYVLLDAPIFRQQTQAVPYPARMDDLTSAIYYSAWNQCIAQACKRFPIDLYHINDYHGCIAPLYLLPRSIPVCLSLHNAEFQGLWPLRTHTECDEVAQVFNLSVDILEQFVQFGEVFNMLHAGASYLRVYQRGFGAVGVSTKYGERAYLRYPIFWGLDKIGHLANPDPSDTGEWDGKHAESSDVVVDEEFEKARPSLRVQAQQWAGLKEDPSAELFVFVGRWSMQKGVDLIADVFPSILKKHPKTQLLCVGPIIDLYGKFAALKLDKLMKQYPDRVCSKPVFTALPPFIFSGAEFALIPSRDEPFGLVAVEFGRKGALGVGSRVGGLGNMPGWWFTIEAMSTQHLLDQFRQAIEDSLDTPTYLRAKMRALSAKQRFPVAAWVEQLDILQNEAIRIHEKQRHRRSAVPNKVMRESINSTRSDNSSAPVTLGYISERPSPSLSAIPNPAPLEIPLEQLPKHRIPRFDETGLRPNDFESRRGSVTNSRPRSPRFSDSHESLLSFNSRATPADHHLIIGEKKDFHLQRVDPFFTDSQETYYSEFERRLDKANNLSGANVCIEEYLERSEKEWHLLRHNAKLGKETSTSIATTPVRKRRLTPLGDEAFAVSRTSFCSLENAEAQKHMSAMLDEFALGQDYKAPRYIKNWMQVRIGDWPIYSFLLSLGQIMAINSYQLTLLTGQVGQEASRLYALCAIYGGSSIILWIMFRRWRSASVLAIPFIFYGFAFFFVGISRYGPAASSRGWLQNVGTGLYTAASASGSLYFSLNFGDEGGSNARTWIIRACVVQGLQQAYTSALWFWGAVLSEQNDAGAAATSPSSHNIANSWKLTAACLPIAVLLWFVSWVLYHGLPTYYKQTPGQTPSFYRSMFRRKVIVWFMVAVLIQNFFLSTQYGRSWRFLWTAQHLTYGQIAALVVLFFVIVWALLLGFISWLSRKHGWLLPILGIGLGAPTWAQIWWGVSGMGSWLPWTTGYVGSALVSRALWLWLGTLGAIQNVGTGVILLATMTRVHVAFALIAAQVLGSIVTAFARATAPNAIGPGPVFPNPLADISVLANGWFWTGLLLNLGATYGYFVFFRKEQLSKP